MIADALLKNPTMKLTEFRASRDRLEEQGMASIGEVFAKQKSIEKIEVYQNGSKAGIPLLLSSLLSCKATLKELHIQDNKSINRAIPELEKFILESTNLEVLDISDMCIWKKHAIIIANAFIKALKSGSKLRVIKWNRDLTCSNTTARTFLSQISALPKNNLQTLEMLGVF